MDFEILQSYQQNYLNNITSDYKRYIYSQIDFSNKLIGLIGARGVGKTTLLLQYLNETNIAFNKKLYISADSIDIDSLFQIAYDFHKIGGKLLIIDEIHKYKNFEIELKKIYDMLSLKVIFSGSSAINIDNSNADLSRRSVMYHLQGLSFREFLELKTNIRFDVYNLEDILNNHIDIAHKILSKIKIYEYFKEYLTYGYYPFYFENNSSYMLKLKDTINAVIETDIPSIFKIEYDKIINLKKLVRLICQSKPFQINIKELSSKIGTSDYHTLYKYLEYLKKGKILGILKSKTNSNNIFSKPDKLYLNNTNLHFAYCQNNEIGTIREVFFYSMFDNERLSSSKFGDFIIDGKYTIEIGGENKKFKQIKDIKESYIVLDDIEIGGFNKIPLWLFGFMY